MGQWGKAKCLWEDPSSCQLPFLSFSRIIYFCQNVVELVIAWNGKSMGKNSNWAENHFLKNVFWLPWQGKCPKTYAILSWIHVFQFPHILGAAGVFPVFFPPCFWLLASFFPWMGGRFDSAVDWVVFLTFWELLVHFSIHVFVISCVFTMAVKSHSRFWLSHWLMVSRTDYLGHSFPAVNCVNW